MDVVSIDTDATLPKGVIKKPGSGKLYVCLRYMGRQIQKSTGLSDSPENRAKVASFMDRAKLRIEDQTFRFADAFPNASEKEKQYFAQREGWFYRPDPDKVLIGDYIRRWKSAIWANFRSENKRRDYHQIIEDRLLPYFGEMTFYQVTNVALQQFMAHLKHRSGPKTGKQLSRSRIDNIMIPLRTIWEDACHEHHWTLPDPFRRIGKHLPPKQESRRMIFLFSEWVQILDKLDPFYRTAVEVMIMTGLSSSELAGLRKCDIDDGYLNIESSVVNQSQKSELKNRYRRRRIPITKELGVRLC